MTTENSTNNTGMPENVKTFTQEEVDKMIQSESDKRVTQALATQKQKYEKQLSLSKLDDTERARVESEERIAELERQLAAYQVEINRSELKSVLSSRGLSPEFADIIAVTEDIQAAKDNMDKLDRLFKEAVKNEVEKRLGAAGGAPKGNAGVITGGITKEHAHKMSLAERQHLKNTQPELYTALFDN